MERPLQFVIFYKPITTILFFLLLLTNLVNGITDQELDAAISALVSNGYNLFGNAIATSDLRFQILSGDNFTLFAPTDSELYSLDLNSEASDYVQNLRYHVVPFRLPMSELINLATGSFIRTMVPYHCLFISNIHVTPFNGIFNGSLTVDGIPILISDLFTGSRIHIHGLGGILALKKIPTMIDSFGDVISISPSVQSNKCFSSFSSSTVPDSVTPASSPEMYSVHEYSPSTMPDSVTPASSPEMCSAHECSPSMVPDSVTPASSPEMHSVHECSPSTMPDSVTPASSPEMYSVHEFSTVPDSVTQASSPEMYYVRECSPSSLVSVPASSAYPFSISEGSPSPIFVPASSPSAASTPAGSLSPAHFQASSPVPASTPVGSPSLVYFPAISPSPALTPVGSPLPVYLPVSSSFPVSTPVGSPLSVYPPASAPVVTVSAITPFTSLVPVSPPPAPVTKSEKKEDEPDHKKREKRHEHQHRRKKNGKKKKMKKFHSRQRHIDYHGYE